MKKIIIKRGDLFEIFNRLEVTKFPCLEISCNKCLGFNNESDPQCCYLHKPGSFVCLGEKVPKKNNNSELKCLDSDGNIVYIRSSDLTSILLRTKNEDKIK